MKKNTEEEFTFIDNSDIQNEYEVVKLVDTCKETFNIESIELPEELDQKMPLLRKVYPPKKKTLKRK